MSNSLDLPVVDQLITEIIEARQAELQAEIARRPQEKRDHLYLSDIHSCTRFLFYSMAEGDKRKPFEPYVQAMLEAGNVSEDFVAAKLAKYGFRVVEKDIRIIVRNRKGETIATGRIDGKVVYKGRRIPMEAKQMAPHTFERINSVEDLFLSEWTEKYVRQLLFYMYGENEEEGFFHLNDGRGHWKLLPLYLGNNLGYVEATLQRMERAFDAFKAVKIPDRIPYNHKLCGTCQFQAVCLPTTVLEGATTIEDPELEAMLARHEELKPLAKQYDEIHESVKAVFKERPETTVGGRFIVRPSVQITKKIDYRAAALAEITKEKLQEYVKESGRVVIEIDDVTKAPEAKE